MASFFKKSFQNRKKRLHLQTKKGDIAQLVEQRTENPCVPGSNPGITTKTSQICGVFFCSKDDISLKKYIKCP